jgi:polyisoprenoid-binding protein YceI
MKASLKYSGLAFLWSLFHLSAAAALLQIDQNKSWIEAAVSSTTGSFIAKLENYQAAIEFVPPAQLPQKADIHFDFKDLKTGIKGRDEHMLEWLQYCKYRTGSFLFKNWMQEGSDSYAIGIISVHGVQREIQMLVSVKHQDEGYDFDGSCDLDYRDFGLKRIRTALVLSVNPHLKIRFHLAGRLVS